MGDISNYQIQESSLKLIHGGQLNLQVQRYNIPRENWLDLSTGISPFSYPADDIPEDIWQRLPEHSAEFETAVANYYQSSPSIVCQGSQTAIQLIPRLWAKLGNSHSRIWLPKVGYKEHQEYWLQANFDCYCYSELPGPQEIEERAVVVVINPNNPSAKIYSKEQLLAMAKQLQRKQGLLIVDEAFIESSIEQSITPYTSEFENVIVLRSVGKFFGLAGARVGFIFSSAEWLELFEIAMGQWPVSGPALWVVKNALTDIDWQRQQHHRLTQQSQKLIFLLEAHFKTATVGTILFRVVLIENAIKIFDALCRQGIYVRLLDDQSGLRFGVTGDRELERLRGALLSIVGG